MCLLKIHYRLFVYCYGLIIEVISKTEQFAQTVELVGVTPEQLIS